MNTLIVLIIIGALIYMFFGKNKNKSSSPTSSSRQKINRQQTSSFKYESSRLIQIINESMDIINKTKNPSTALKRFDDIKRSVEDLFNILPSGQSLTVELNKSSINSIRDLYVVDKEKAQWLEDHNKEKAQDDILKSTALSQWVKVFNKALEDDHISEEELMELDDLEERLGLTKQDTNVYWQSYKLEKPSYPIAPHNDLNFLDQRVEKEWVLRVSFGKSRSNNFKQVLSSIQIHPKYKFYKGPNDEDIHELSFSPEEIIEFEQLWQRVKNWKSTIVKINDEIIDRKSLSKMLICYRDKLKEKNSNPLFCYGASPFTYNLFGCHRTMVRDGISATQMSWFHIGNFDNQGIFHVDKEAIATIINKSLYTYRICPALDIDTIIRGFNMIPDMIDPSKDSNWTIEPYYTGANRLSPVLRYKSLYQNSSNISAGQFSIDLDVTARIADYYSSISPQFQAILNIESKK